MPKQEYEVKFELVADESVAPETVEDTLERLVDELLSRGAGVAIGPAGAIHGSVLELGFTVEAADMAEVYSKLHAISDILNDTGTLEFSATSARRGDRELAYA